MNDPRTSVTGAVADAARALGAPPWTDGRIARHLAPLFARHRAAFAGRIYLANHSLGRPLDATADDIQEGIDAWYLAMGGAWDAWEAEENAHRARLASLVGAPRADTLVPKTSAGQGLRAALGSFDRPPRVVTTRGEFDSLDLILREWARRGRLSLAHVEPRAPEPGVGDARALAHTAIDDLVAAVTPSTDLVVVSEVMFQTGERLADLPRLVAHAHACGAKVLVDLYHSLGVLPVDVAALDVDFAVGGSYKYLRGGPGACFLYVAPRLLDAGLRTLDTGWFAKEGRFEYRRPEPPAFAQGGDGWLESTPAVLSAYQARAGQELVIALGAAALREDSLARQRALVQALDACGVPAIGGTEDRGAFVVVKLDAASGVADRLREVGIVADARGECLRLCPDVLTTAQDLDVAARRIGAVVAGTARASR
ncbi:MAG: aminotransferase class V-fold PLP-dependent enzyme [Betaproteobacteria bacterium]